MPKRQKLTLVFIILVFFALIIFLLFKLPVFSTLASFVQNIFAPLQIAARNTIFRPSLNSIKEQNLELTKKLVDQQKLLQDNKALRDQFEIIFPKSQTLIPAIIVGSPSFIPGVTTPEAFVLDKGTKDGVRKGQAVVYKDNLIGIVTKTNDNYSNVALISSPSNSLTAQTLENGASGTIKGQGAGQIIFENVLLSQKLSTGDLVVSRGSMNDEGFGISPNLIIGKVVSVNKNPSSLFQSAKIEPLIDSLSLTALFIVKNL